MYSTEMEMKGELIIAAAEKEPIESIQKILEVFKKKDAQQKNVPVRIEPNSPAPFYDELHFADYE